LNIGVTGHQTLDPGQRWSWVETRLRDILVSNSRHAVSWSSLAPGADQLFATVSLSVGIPLHVVIPFPGYTDQFSPSDQLEFKRLLPCARVVETLVSDETDPESLYMAAGQYIIDQADLVLAVFDVMHHRGRGGTADIVDYARKLSRTLFIIDPRSEVVTTS
jgi:hypothetical protein